ncbi:DUF4870 domain-containing protein [Oscillospiraceae bacterium CM]|nr:DUF4870 domain-containing protein [Oscillospiraceae bacterium CM]
MKVNPHRSSLGMDANTMALLCYLAAFLLSWIPVIKYVAFAAPLVIFFLEKDSPFVKFHAMQALILEAISWLFTVVFSIIIGIINAAYAATHYYYYWVSAPGAVAMSAVLVIIGVILTVFAIIAMVKAYGYEEFKIPLIGNMAEKFSKGGAAL